MKSILLLFAFCFSMSAFAQPSVGQIGIPVWTANGTSTVWMTPQNNKVIGVNGSGNLELVAGGGSSTLGAMTDVSLTSLTSGQLLRYNGSGWVNWTPDYLSTSTAASTYHPLTSTSTGGNGTADSGKLMTFNSTGGLSLGSSSNNGGATGLTIYSGTANGLLVESAGVGAQAIDVQLNGTSAQAYSIHAAASYAVGVLYDGSGDNATGIGARLSTNGAGLLICNVDDNDKFGIQGATGNLEWYGSATTPFSGTNKTVLAAATPSGTHTITMPNDQTGNVVTTGGTGTVSATMLASTAVTPGTYTNMTGTVDADGRLTAASSGSGGVTSITGTANQITVTGTTTPTLSLAATITGLTSVTSTTFVGALTGTASGNAVLGANTFTGAQTNSTASAASSPAHHLTGAICTGGTGTTNLPHFLIQPSGATAFTSLSTSGTALGINLDVNAGNLIDAGVDGVSTFKISAAGQVTISSNLIAAGGYVRAGNIYANSTSNVLELFTNSGIVSIGSSEVVNLNRDTNYTLGIKNGTNPMAVKLYETASGSNDEYLEISAAAGTNTIKPVATGSGTASTVRYYTTPTVWFGSGSGTPESVETAGIGSVFTDTATGTLYRKTSGTGNTGWVTP